MGIIDLFLVAPFPKLADAGINTLMNPKSLEALCNEAGNRLTDFELVQDIAMRAAEAYDGLDIQPFELAGGIVHCVGSRVIANSGIEPDLLAVTDDGLLQRQRRYPELTAEAYLVGLWPHSSDAALYYVQTPFDTGNSVADRPFAETAVDVLTSHVNPYFGYQILPTTDGDTLLGRNVDAATVQTRGLDMRVIGEPGATLR